MNKWKALKREYKKTVDHNAQTGSKMLCPFYEEFGELNGYKSGTRPTYTMSSRMKLNQGKREKLMRNMTQKIQIHRQSVVPLTRRKNL